MARPDCRRSRCMCSAAKTASGGSTACEPERAAMTFRATLANHPMLFGAFALILGLVLLVLLFIIRVGVGGGPVSGRVIDVDTNLPITGAIVVAQWQKSSLSLADSTSYCIHVETAASA